MYMYCTGLFWDSRRKRTLTDWDYSSYKSIVRVISQWNLQVHSLLKSTSLSIYFQMTVSCKCQGFHWQVHVKTTYCTMSTDQRAKSRPWHTAWQWLPRHYDSDTRRHTWCCDWHGSHRHTWREHSWQENFVFSAQTQQGIDGWIWRHSGADQCWRISRYHVMTTFHLMLDLLHHLRLSQTTLSLTS